jgi:hypothetical protein
VIGWSLGRTTLTRSSYPLTSYDIHHTPHTTHTQGILESFWIPDLTTADNFLLDFDLIVVPDPVMAKYLVEVTHI